MHWGNVAEWATVVVAAVAVGIALRTYRDSTWSTKVAAARLVWAQTGVAMGWSKGKKFSGLSEQLFPGHAKEVGNPFGFFETGENGRPSSTLVRDLTVFRVQVTNHSDEPISRVRLSLTHPRHGLLSFGGGRPAFNVLAPKATRNANVFAALKYNSRDTRITRVELSFTDSAGRRWRRVSMSPPKEIKVRRRPRVRVRVQGAWMKFKHRLRKRG